MIKELTMVKNNYLNNWELKKWDDVLDIRSGRNQKAVLNPNGKYPIIGSAGKVMGYADDYICEEGTTIIGRKGTINSPLFIEHKFWNVDTAFGLHSKESLDNRFLHYFCLSFDFTELDKGSGRPSLVKSDLLKVQIPIPPLPQQKQIVAILDKAFAVIDTAKANAEQNLQNAKELFESYLQNVFENKGDDWEEKVFDNVIASSQIGIVRNSKQQSSENPFRYFKMNNILNNNGINDVAYKYIEASADEVEKYRLYKNDFLFNTRNSLELVGKSCLYLSENEELTLFNNNILRVTFRVFLLPQFVAYAFSSKTIKDSLELIKSGTTGVSGIYYKNLKNLKIPFPLIEKQQIIVQKLDALSTETKKLEAIYTQKIADLEEMKKSVLQKAFSGQLNTIN